MAGTVTAYSSYDPLAMPEQLVAVLRYFDGRPTNDALAAIRAERGINVTAGLVRRLVDVGVLQAAEDPPAPPHALLGRLSGSSARHPEDDLFVAAMPSSARRHGIPSAATRSA